MTVQARFVVVGLFLLTLLGGCVHRIPPEFECEPGWETKRQESPVLTRSLSGVVLDASGAPLQVALVERMNPDFKQRLAATGTDEHGPFRFRRAAETNYLRFRMLGFKRLRSASDRVEAIG